MADNPTRMAPDYRRVVVEEIGNDWDVQAVVRGNDSLTVHVWAHGDLPMPESELRSFAAALIKAADALSIEGGM